MSQPTPNDSVDLFPDHKEGQMNIPCTPSPTGTMATMRPSALTLLTLWAFVFPCSAAARTNEDSVAVRKQFEAYLQTFNTRDASALSAFFTEDADFVMGNLPAVHGKKGVEEWWRKYFARQEPGRSGTFVLKSFRLLAPDVALVNIETTTGGRDPRGIQLHPRKARGTWLMHRESGTWLISAIRGMPTTGDSVVLAASQETATSLRPDVRAFVGKYADAFNTHDPLAVSAFFRTDADIIVRNSPLVQGSEAIQNWWQTYFATPRPYTLILIVDAIRALTDDVVQVNLTATGTNGGELRPIRQAAAMWILTRQGGTWRIAALRVMPGEDDRLIRR